MSKNDPVYDALIECSASLLSMITDQYAPNGTQVYDDILEKQEERRKMIGSEPVHSPMEWACIIVENMGQLAQQINNKHYWAHKVNG